MHLVGSLVFQRTLFNCKETYFLEQLKTYHEYSIFLAISSVNKSFFSEFFIWFSLLIKIDMLTKKRMKDLLDGKIKLTLS